MMQSTLHDEHVLAAVSKRKGAAIRDDAVRGAFVLSNQARRKVYAFEVREPEALQCHQAVSAAAKKLHNLSVARPLSGTPAVQPADEFTYRSEEHTSELQSQSNLVCRLLL